MNALSAIRKIFGAVSLAAWCCMGHAGGLLGLDHMLSKSDTGGWSRSNQLVLEYASALIVLGGGLWEGSESRIGKTYWQAGESMVLGALASTSAKLVFQRERPIQGDGPNAWFKGGSSKSFPSGEVTHISAIVTPFIAEYHENHPAVWGLAALPLYDAVARMKSQAHWQSDVLAGMALGAGIGLYAHDKPHGVFIDALPKGLTVGLKTRF